MGDVFESIDDSLGEWIQEREMFFVATAPLSGDGLVNCSPKGLDTFRIIDPLTVAYADLIGSGIETVAHIRENGRIVIMFCAFQGPPRIVRLHGIGKFHDVASEKCAQLQSQFGEHRNLRGIIEISVTRIAESCGYGVPKFDYVGQRETLTKWSNQKTDQELTEYRRQNNSRSLDGLAGI